VVVCRARNLPLVGYQPPCLGANVEPNRDTYLYHLLLVSFCTGRQASKKQGHKGHKFKGAKVISNMDFLKSPISRFRNESDRRYEDVGAACHGHRTSHPIFSAKKDRNAKRAESKAEKQGRSMYESHMDTKRGNLEVLRYDSER
jgi:hypothetical protein